MTDAVAPSSDRLPGDSGVWTFIVADLGAFAVFFLLFAVGRAEAPQLYEQSRQHLNVTFGLINTLILLTSSLTMVHAVRAAKAGKSARVVRYLVLTVLIGSGFAVIKAIEYSDKIRAGVTLVTNEFYTYYFAFTGIHLLHFCVGIGALLFTIGKARKSRMAGPFTTWIEAVGTYWHMVDLLWIMLFPVIYLL